MTKLHELLAAEKTVVAAANTLVKETTEKFGKEAYFSGHSISLKMLRESPENAALEAAGRDERTLPTTVPDTLDYMLNVWGRAEDLLFQKNVTNTMAFAELRFRGVVLHPAVPVDELMGLEVRLGRLRDEVYKRMPTLDASKAWQHRDTDPSHVYSYGPEQTTKTQKIMYPVVMAEATDKHPAQVKEATRDEIVGVFSRTLRNGAATTAQKAECLQVLDELIKEVKTARQRANSVDAEQGTIATAIIKVLMEPFK